MNKGSTATITGIVIVLIIMIAAVISGVVYFVESTYSTSTGAAINNVENVQSNSHIQCSPNWSCGEWRECISGTQTRNCVDLNNCNISSGKPVESQSCYKKFKVGDTISDGKLAITLNKIKYVKTIDEWITTTAPENKTYLILDITIENLQSKQIDMGLMGLDIQIYSAEGYVSRGETGIQANFLENPFPYASPVYLLPNSKIRGEIPYEVFDNATGLKVIFTYYSNYLEFLDKSVVIFDL